MAIGEGERFDGGCLCGAIRYTATGPERYTLHCCCKDCRKASGASHATLVAILSEQLYVRDRTDTYTTKGDSGGEVKRHFCGKCGGQLYLTGDLHGYRITLLQAGSLDNLNRVSPEGVIYARDAAEWDCFNPDLPKFEAMQPRGQ